MITWKGINQTKMEGAIERHLPKTDEGVVGSAGEDRQDVEIKRKSEKIEAFEQKHCVVRLQ